MVRFSSYRALAVVTLTLLAGCGRDLGEPLQSGQVLPWQGLQGRWVGSVVPTGPSCGRTTQGLMSIGPKGFAFDPFQSTTVVQGAVDKDGHLSATVARLGGEKQNLTIEFNGAANQSGSNADL